MKSATSSAGGERLKIKGNDDGSGRPARGPTTASPQRCPRARSRPGADRNPLFVFLMLHRAVAGHGRQRLLQAQHLDHRRLALRRRAIAAAMPASPSSTWASTSARSSRSCCARSSPTRSAGGPASASPAGGMLLSCCLIQFDGGRLAGYGERPAARQAGPRSADLRRRPAGRAGGLFPVHQPDELGAARGRARASSAMSCACRSWARCCSAPSSSAFPASSSGRA